MDINFIGYFIAGRLYFWLNYRGRRSRRLYVNFPQVLDLKAPFFYRKCGIFTTHYLRSEKTLGFYFVVGGAFILYLQLILTIYITITNSAGSLLFQTFVFLVSLYKEVFAMFLQIYFRTLINLLEVGNFSFSIYSFFGRNWWSCKDLVCFT